MYVVVRILNFVFDFPVASSAVTWVSTSNNFRTPLQVMKLTRMSTRSTERSSARSSFSKDGSDFADVKSHG